MKNTNITIQETLTLIKGGKYPCDSSNVNDIDHNRNTALHVASKYWHSEIVESLVEMKGNVNAENDSKFTPLFCALNTKASENNTKQEEVIRTLLGLKANPNATNKVGETPLWPAVNIGNLTIVQNLINSKSDISHKDDPEEGDTILSFVKKYEKYRDPQYKEIIIYLQSLASESNNSEPDLTVTGATDITDFSVLENV